MIVAKIKGIGRLTPIEPGSPADLKLEAGEIRIMSLGDGSPGRAEKGKAIVQVKLLSGDWEGIDTLLVVGESPLYAKLLSASKTLLGGTKLDLYFDQVFMDGFTHTIRDYIFRGGGLIGFTRAELESLQDVETQRLLLKNLIDLFFTSKKEQIAASEEMTDPEHAIIFEPGLDLPREDHAVIRTLQFSDDEAEQYEALYATFKSILLPRWEFESYNKIFGYPDNVQSCVAFEAERLKEGLEYSEDIYDAAVEWQLLLQVAPYCRKFNFIDTFGDGQIYFMIRRRDLASGNFSNVQLVVQST